MQPAGAFIELFSQPCFVLKECGDGALLFGNCNQMWCDLIGRAKADLVGRPIADLPNKTFDPLFDVSALKDLPHGAQLECQITLPNGQIALMVTVDRSAEHDLPRYLAIHEPPPPVLPAQVVAQSLTEEIEQFISFAAHDLRTPMRNIESLAEMLRDDFVDMGDGKLQLIDMLEDVAV